MQVQSVRPVANREAERCINFMHPHPVMSFSTHICRSAALRGSNSASPVSFLAMSEMLDMLLPWREGVVLEGAVHAVLPVSCKP